MTEQTACDLCHGPREPFQLAEGDPMERQMLDDDMALIRVCEPCWSSSPCRWKRWGLAYATA